LKSNVVSMDKQQKCMEIPTITTSTSNTNNSSDYDKMKVAKEMKQKSAEDSQKFEDFLQDITFNDLTDANFGPEWGYDYYDTTYANHDLSVRKKRSLPEDNVESVNDLYDSLPTSYNDMVDDGEVFTVTIYNVSSDKDKQINYIITGLDPYSEYMLKVHACNDGLLYDNTHDYCGGSEITSGRALKDKHADKISNLRTVVTSKDELVDSDSHRIRVIFDSPLSPNGFILYYKIHVVYNNHKKIHCCVSKDYRYYGTDDQYCPLENELPPGTYYVSVQPVSLASDGVISESVVMVVPQYHQYTTIVAVVVAFIIAIMMVIVAAILHQKYRRKKLRYGACTPNPVYAQHQYTYQYECDDYEIDENDITLLKEIGNGHFGKVYVGKAKGVVKGEEESLVAVKTLLANDFQNKQRFLKEATVMKAFNAYHVVRLLGVVSKTQKPMVLMEYMLNGDLKTYLRANRTSQTDDTSDVPYQVKLQMCGEIADGMAYLEKNKFVHRDLAARNCLVSDDLTVKIADFGLAVDVYETDYYRIGTRGILPVRWMSPESLKDGVFDSRSDVWSYGVVLWEVVTDAQQPYQGRQHEQVTRLVIDGGYMLQPKQCTTRLYELMLMCWQYSPAMRPTFLEIVKNLEPEMNDKFKHNSFYHETLQCTAEHPPNAEQQIEDTSPTIHHHHHNSSTVMNEYTDLSRSASNKEYVNTKHHTNNSDETLSLMHPQNATC